MEKIKIEISLMYKDERDCTGTVVNKLKWIKEDIREKLKTIIRNNGGKATIRIKSKIGG